MTHQSQNQTAPAAHRAPTLSVYRHLWGLDGSWSDWLPKIKAAGYVGVEGMPPAAAERAAFRAELDALGLDFVAQIVTCWPRTGGNADEHFRSFQEQVDAAMPLRPVFFNSHSGVDMWPLSESRTFLKHVVAWQDRNQLDVGHETHRGRIFFNPRDTLQLAADFPSLRFTADFSHWVNVCERIVDDDTLGLSALAPRIRHIHARVGYEQGPQVPDPRAPEYDRHVVAHERWWSAIWKARQAAGDTQFSLTPEFGPPDYQHTLPYSRIQVADPWEVSLWMAQRQRQRFAAFEALIHLP